MGGSTKQKRNGLKEYSNKVHLFNLKSGYWYELDSMPVAKETSGILIKDKIYLIGGFNKKPLTEIETFDLISKKWTVEGHLFYGIENPAIATNKNMIIQITDTELLEKKGGIVQGMSGSPIVQNGKLIVAITHVFVNDPSSGHAVFITSMLDQ